MQIKAARHNKRCVQIGTQRRSGQSFMEAVQKLNEGVIGRVYLARSWYNNLRPSIGRRVPAEVPAHFDYELWQGPAPRVPYREYDLDGNRTRHYNWHWLWHWGNGGNWATTASTHSTSPAGGSVSTIRFVSRPPADATAGTTIRRPRTRTPFVLSSRARNRRRGTDSAATNTK